MSEERLRLCPESSVVHPGKVEESAWRARYAPEYLTKTDQFRLAEIAEDWLHIINMSQKQRNELFSKIKQALSKQYTQN